MQIFKKIPEKFGVTLIFLDCAFCAELQRDSIEPVMLEIDNQLTEQGAPDDCAARVEMMMDNATSISTMVANREMDHSEGVADIAYSAIYAFGKTVGFDKVSTLRGLTGTYLRNVLSLNPCLGDLEYDQETANLQRAMGAMPDGPWDIEPANMPTLH